MAPHAHAFSCSLTKVALSSIDRRQTLQNPLLRHALNTQYKLSALRCSASKPRSRCLSRPCISKASTGTTSHDDRHILLVPLPAWSSPFGPGPEPVTTSRSARWQPPPSCRLELPAATCSGSDVSSRHSPLPLRYARADPAVTDHRSRRQETLVTVASYQQSRPPSVAGWL